MNTPVATGEALPTDLEDLLSALACGDLTAVEQMRLHDLVLPALSHPAAPVGVSEEMAERAARVVAGSDEEWDDYGQIVRDGLMEIQHAALTAALQEPRKP